MRRGTLPLGIDFGATRIRVAQAEHSARGARLRAVAVRDLCSGMQGSNAQSDAEYVSTLIEEAVAEIGTTERRCVCAIGEPDALLRAIALPKMTAVERARAAWFESQRHVDYPMEEAVVRVHRVDASAGSWAIGVARKAAIVTRTATLRAARLKVVAIDHEACALLRVLDGFDAVIDIGYHRTCLHVAGEGSPVTFAAFNGGADITRAIERDLAIDNHTAEKRKRILGTAGAGDRARAALAADIAALIERARASSPIRRVAMVGNAARLAGLGRDIECASNVVCEIPVSDALRGEYFPDDVARSGAPDWTLAAGLALWNAR